MSRDVQQQSDDFLGRLTGAKNKASEVMKKLGGSSSQDRASEFAKRLGSPSSPTAKRRQVSGRRSPAGKERTGKPLRSLPYEDDSED
jgi:hypothetical protein